MVIVRRGNTILVRAKNAGHAINIFAQKYGYDLEYAVKEEGIEIEFI